MDNQEKKDEGQQLSRRDFLKTSAAATAGVWAAGLPVANFVHAAPNETLKVGVIGLGGRGSGAIRDHIRATTGTVVWALGDYWPGKAKSQLGGLQKDLGDRCQVTPERCFEGFDNYKQVIDSGVDLIVTAAPPGFRPLHFRYAVEKGKHVFMEKPVATCPTGAKIVMEAAKLARQKGLGVVAGTQRRHQRGYVETVKRIQAGDIGDILHARCYWNGGRPWNRGTNPNLTEIEQQMNNWYHYTWLCGDHITEQHIHNLDVINWCFGQGGGGGADDKIAHPTRAMAVGGLSSHRDWIPDQGINATKSTEPGEAWDCFAVEFEYDTPAGPATVQSYCRHWDGCPGAVWEHVTGTKGRSNPGGSIDFYDKTRWGAPGGGRNPYEQEHADLVESIRAGKPLNEGESVATSAMIAIMGRLAAYTGQIVTWDFLMNKSQLSYIIEDPKAGPHPVEPIAIPGRTKLI